MKKTLLITIVTLGTFCAFGQAVELGELPFNALIETNAPSRAETTNIVEAAIGEITAESLGALTAEADTLATVTARGATTTKAVTIGSRGAGGVGTASFANGANVVASGYYSHAEGVGTTASGYYSHAEGLDATASGYSSHAEGVYATASGNHSHAEGGGTTASGYSSHAEGGGTTASGDYSHAEGVSTTASGDYSHASGFNSVASNITAFAWQGSDGGYSESPYESHGNGTFNINPVGGLAGLWIGETNMATTLSGYATTGAVAAVQAEVAGTNWLYRAGLTGTVAFANAGNRPQAWSGSGNLIVTEISGLAPPAQVYWTLQGFSSVTLPAGIYAVGGGTWQTGMVNHFAVWQVGDTTMITFLTATEIE